MQDIAIMYHYVREKESWKGSVPIEPDEFRKQILWAKEHYEIVTPNDLHKKTKKPKCVITFDDATKDQYNIAYPILKELGVPAYFAIMSGPLKERKIPVFHLVHTVLSHFDDEEIWYELNRLYDIPDISEKSSYYHYEKNVFRRYNKYVFNFLWDELKSRRYLEGKVLSLYGSLESFINEFYISKDEILEMHENGMTIGVHCVNHLPYSEDALLFFEMEIRPCIKFLKNELNLIPEWYTPAFGGGENASRMRLELESILRKNGIKGAFTTQEGYNQNIGDSFWINRFDCNRMPKEFL